MFVRDYSWQLDWSARSVRSPRGVGLQLFWISRGLQVVVHTVQRRQAQLMCVGSAKVRAWKPIRADFDSATFYPQYFVISRDGLDPQMPLDLIQFKKCAWVIESWEPGPELDTGGKYIYRKITENTCLLIFCMDLSLRIIYSLLRTTQQRVFSTNKN